MKVDVFMLEFREQGGMFLPKDSHLHKLAVEYSERRLATRINFTDYRNVWVSCEVDEVGKPIKATGLFAMVFKADFPVARFDNSAAVVKLTQRVRSFLQDSCSARGGEAFLYISETEDESQRCPKWKRWLKIFKAEPAERYRITI